MDAIIAPVQVVNQDKCMHEIVWAEMSDNFNLCKALCGLARAKRENIGLADEHNTVIRTPLSKPLFTAASWSRNGENDAIKASTHLKKTLSIQITRRFV